MLGNKDGLELTEPICQKKKMEGGKETISDFHTNP